MRFMVIVKATQASEAGEMPSEELLAAMGRYNEELVKAGVMLAGEGLQPSAKGARVRFSGNARTVIDGLRRDPRADRRFLDVPGGLLEEAIEWVKRCPNPFDGESEIEIRQVFEAEDFGEEFTRNCASARSACAPSWKNATEPPALRQERGKRHANRPLPDLQR